MNDGIDLRRGVERAVGQLRHRSEQETWERSLHGARWLLEQDLAVIDDYRRSGTRPAFHGYEASTFSQNGEDGILQRIVDCVGAGTKTFVEIGAADGSENCTRNLAEQGWGGIWVEGDPERAAIAAKLPAARNVTVVAEFVSVANVVRLLRDAGASTEFDLLSLDIDGNDYWVMRELLSVFRPRIVVAEYNGSCRYPWTTPYREVRSWDRSWDFGCSLALEAQLMERSGYRLIGCDGVGVNAFYLRGDVDPGALAVGTAGDFYVPPIHRPGTLGHPRISPIPERDPVPLTPSELNRVELRSSRLVGPDVRGPGELAFVVANVVNGSGREIASSGEHPVYLAYRTLCLDRPGFDMGEPARAPLSSVVAAGQARPSAVEVSLPVVPGEYAVVPTLVQEFVSWRTAKPTEAITVTIEATA